jgi:hypothetical protein
MNCRVPERTYAIPAPLKRRKSASAHLQHPDAIEPDFPRLPHIPEAKETTAPVSAPSRFSRSRFPPTTPPSPGMHMKINSFHRPNQSFRRMKMDLEAADFKQRRWLVRLHTRGAEPSSCSGLS